MRNLKDAVARLANSLKVTKGQPVTAPVEVTLAESQFLGSCVALCLTAELARRAPEGTPLRDKLVARGEHYGKGFQNALATLEAQQPGAVGSLGFKFMAAEVALTSE